LAIKNLRAPTSITQVAVSNRDPAGRPAGDLLTLAARRERREDFGLTSDVHDTIGLIERIERMRDSGLALTPTAMARMDNQWRSEFNFGQKAVEDLTNDCDEKVSFDGSPRPCIQPRVAFFGFQLVNTSPQLTTPAA
jgi:hypothetical protein